MATARSTGLMLRKLSEKDQKHHTYRSCMKRSPLKQFENCESFNLGRKRALSVPVCKNSRKDSEEQTGRTPRAADRYEPQLYTS
jgi:hypothetical protein